MMFRPHQADAVRLALRKGLAQEGPPSQGLDARLRDALADTGRARFTADQKDDVKSALRSCDEKNLRVDLGAALAGPEGKPTADVDGPAERRAEARAEFFFFVDRAEGAPDVILLVGREARSPFIRERGAEARVEALAWRAFLVQPLAQGAPHGVGLVGREHHVRASSQAHFWGSPAGRGSLACFFLCFVLP